MISHLCAATLVLYILWIAMAQIAAGQEDREKTTALKGKHEKIVVKMKHGGCSLKTNYKSWELYCTRRKCVHKTGLWQPKWHLLHISTFV